MRMEARKERELKDDSKFSQLSKWQVEHFEFRVVI